MKCYTYNALQMAEVLAKDLKTGQYMHLAPRKSYFRERLGTSMRRLQKE